MAATDRPVAFVDIPSIIIVLGGTLAALFISFEPKLPGALSFYFGPASNNIKTDASLKDEVGRIVRWAYIVQKNGLQGLVNNLRKFAQGRSFLLVYGADLVVTGYTAGAEIKQILEYTLESQIERDSKDTEALKKMGRMLQLLVCSERLSVWCDYAGKYEYRSFGDWGLSMAVALITTFYGIILARIFFIP